MIFSCGCKQTGARISSRKAVLCVVRVFVLVLPSRVDQLLEKVTAVEATPLTVVISQRQAIATRSGFSDRFQYSVDVTLNP